MNIRKAVMSDLEKCIKIGKIPELAYLQKLSSNEAKKYLKEFLDNGILIVAEENGEIIGFLNAEYMLGNFVWIDGIAVKKEFRRRSIGKKLINKLYKILKRRIKHIYLIAPKINKNTIKFYESIGMKKGKEFIEFSQDF